MNIIEQFKITTIMDNSNIERNEKLELILDSITTNESKYWNINDGNSKIKFRLVTITPEIAEIFLNYFNNTNRPISDANVLRLAKEMVNGKWLNNFEPISFNKLGDSTNGQHRFKALIKTNMSFPFLIITGLEPEVYDTIDGGRKRTTSDVLAHAGVMSAKNTSSVCKFIYGFKEGKYGAHRNTSERSLNNTAILEYYTYLGESDVHDSVNFGLTYSKKANGIITPTILGSMFYIFNQIDRDKSYEFLSKLATGDNLTNTSPILALRNKLIKAKIDNTYYLTPDMLIKNIVYCWEKFINGEKVQKIKLPEDYTINLK
jgi:hypothetical protein